MDIGDTLSVIKRRYACRKFGNKPINDDILEKIGLAAVQAPSAMNLQLWHISVVKNKQLLAEIESEGMRAISQMPDQSIHQRIMGRGGMLFYNAQAVAFIGIKPDEKNNGMVKTDLGIAAQNISLSATALGVDNCHCGLIAHCFSTESASQFYEKLKFPKGYECSYGILLGYAAEKGTPHTPDKSKYIII